MEHLKFVIEKRSDGFIAYPLGLKGAIVGQGETYDAALQNARSAVKFHVETFGPESIEIDLPILAAYIDGANEKRTVSNIDNLWHSSDPVVWDKALLSYWNFVMPANVALEREMERMDRDHIESLDERGWYDFLLNKYFRWKYTAPNRYATTTRWLKEYADSGKLTTLDEIKQKLLTFDVEDICKGLAIACEIKGLGVAGASGLLSLIFPEWYGTVDQFVVKALREVKDLVEVDALAKMNPENLKISDGVLLIQVMHRKAEENNRLFGGSYWTPRKIDQILWTFGR